MKSIFVKIYGGILLTVIVVVICVYGAVTQYNNYRLEKHIQSISSGTFSLVAEAMERLQPEQQLKWLAVVEKLTDVEIKLLSINQANLHQFDRESLKDGRLLVKTHDNSQLTQLYKPLNNRKGVLSAQLQDVDEQLLRLTSLLILNELQRTQTQSIENELADLQTRFSFDVSTIVPSKLDLTYAQQRLLQRKEMVVKLHDNERFLPSIAVYSPIDGTELALSVGPIALFDEVSLEGLLVLALLGFGVISIVAYLLIRPLQKRLNVMAIEVESIGLEPLQRESQTMLSEEPVHVVGDDVLSHLGRKINAMSKRIQSLLQAQRELTEAVSHELRTPIARINFHLTLLEDNLADRLKSSDRKYIEGIYNDADALEGLVDEILSYARLEQAQPELHMLEFDLAAALEDLLTDIHPLKPEIDIQLKLPVICSVTADAHYLIRACKNLMVNAQQYAEQQITVVLKEEKHVYRLSVEDDGPGIAAEDKEHIFTPFKRLDPSRNKAFGGYGLGLAIVFQIMRWHHGTVYVEDSPLGGSSFVLQWPKDI